MLKFLQVVVVLHQEEIIMVEVEEAAVVSVAKEVVDSVVKEVEVSVANVLHQTEDLLVVIVLEIVKQKANSDVIVKTIALLTTKEDQYVEIARADLTNNNICC